MPVIKASDSITLLPVDVTLAPTLFDLVNKNRTYLREWLGWLDSNNSVEDTRKHLEQSLQENDEGNKLSFGIFLYEKLVGMISLHKIDWTNKEAIIGYWLDADHQGKGIMTLSCKALIDFIFNELHLNKVIIKCATGNEKSKAIPKKLGFQEVEIVNNARLQYDHYIDIIIYEKIKETQ